MFKTIKHLHLNVFLILIKCNVQKNIAIGLYSKSYNWPKKKTRKFLREILCRIETKN